jgi:hypothetical protein
MVLDTLCLWIEAFELKLGMMNSSQNFFYAVTNIVLGQ